MSYSGLVLGKLIWDYGSSEEKVVDGRGGNQVESLLRNAAVNNAEDTPVIVMISTDKALIDWINLKKGRTAAIVPVEWIKNLGERIRCPDCHHLIEPYLSPFTGELSVNDPSSSRTNDVEKEVK
jgi:hypothetical protein